MLEDYSRTRPTLYTKEVADSVCLLYVKHNYYIWIGN